MNSEWKEPTSNDVRGHAHIEACPRELRVSVEKDTRLLPVVSKPPLCLRACLTAEPPLPGAVLSGRMNLSATKDGLSVPGDSPLSSGAAFFPLVLTLFLELALSFLIGQFSTDTIINISIRRLKV